MGKHVREEVRTISRQIERFGGKKEQITNIRELIQQLDSDLKPISEIVPRRIAPIEVPLSKRPLQVGDLVWVASLDRTGNILSISGDGAEVQAGSFRLRVALRDLVLTNHESQASTTFQKPLRADISLPRVDSPGMEIDLRGHSVEEMLPLLQKYLDDAYLSGLPFMRIIHGKGGGILRHAVREELRHHSLVKEYRTGEHNEGGDGVTIAWMVEG